MKILARKLNEQTTDFLWDNLKGHFTLVMDDGEIETNARMTLYSHYAWEFHRRYPKTPLLKKHMVQEMLGDAKLGAGTHISLLQNILWDTFDAYPEIEKVQLVDELSKLAYFVTNQFFYNQLQYRTEEYVGSLDIVDFVEVFYNPKVQAALENVEPTSYGIDKAYSAIQYALKKDPDLENNALSIGVRSKLIKEAQVLQTLGPRGFVTDIDSNLFPHPITVGYLTGFKLLHDSMIESRSASKALYFSKRELQDAEYFSRKLQLLCQTVKNLHPGDCGSQNYLNWHVRPPVFDEDGSRTYDGDLRYMLGKWFLNPDTNKLEEITKNHKHLENKIVKIRSVVAGCSHPDPYGICSTCFGTLADIVPENTNIGQYASTTLTQKSSQAILSTKHHDKNSSSDAIYVSPEDKKFLKVSSDGASYLLAETLKGKKVKIMIASQEATGLSDITFVDSVNKLAMTRVSEITDIAFVIENKEIEQTIPVSVNRGKRLASLSYPALEYIKKHNWSVDDKGNYIIDISDWNFSEKFLTLPVRHHNMSDVTQAIAQTLESNMMVIKSKDDAKDPEAILVELFDLVTKHLEINLVVLEVTLLGAMVVSNSGRDFRIPKSYTTREMGASKQTIPNRSMGAAMAYEYHVNTIFDPASFFKTFRPDHPFDVMLCPREVLSQQ